MENLVVLRGRRNFLKTAGTGVLTAGALSATAVTMEGCSASQWLTTLENDLPTLIQIATNIAGIIATAQGGGVLAPALAAEISGIGTDISNGLKALTGVVNSYNAASATAKPGILGDIVSGINSIQGNLQALLTAAHINNPALQATITGSISLAMTTLLAIETLLPSTPAPTPAPAAFPRARVSVQNAGEKVSNPKNVDLHQVLVASYNEVVSANGFSQYKLAR